MLEEKSACDILTRTPPPFSAASFEPGMYDPEHASCAICISDYAPGDTLRVLPCSSLHHFHKGCVDE